MKKGKNNSTKRECPKKHRSIKEQAIRQVHMAGFNDEETESLIKEIEEICAFEDSLED